MCSMVMISSTVLVYGLPLELDSRPRWSRGNLLALRSMNFFSTSPQGGLYAGGLDSEILGSLKNLKPEKIGL